MRASIWALTFSTRATARTTGTGSAPVARPPASSKTATLFTGANVSATRTGQEAERCGRVLGARLPLQEEDFEDRDLRLRLAIAAPAFDFEVAQTLGLVIPLTRTSVNIESVPDTLNQ